MLTAISDWLIPLPELQRTRGRIEHFIHRTPLVRSQFLSDRLGTNIYLKLEVFQKTGSFKVRGAFNRLLTLSDNQKSTGVVAVSGGNHAQAVAYAARTLGIKATVLMPESAPLNSIAASRDYGATVQLTSTLAEAFEVVHQRADQGAVYIHPFDDIEVIAGQGTLGLELLEDTPELTDVIASVGGGGLVGGVGSAVKQLKSNVRIWGVETEGADAMAQAFEAGKVVRLEKTSSIAVTLAAPAVTPRTLALSQQCLESVTVVSDAEAIAAIHLLLERTKVMTEPAAACTLAAAERLSKHFGREHHVALVLCGGNFSVQDLARTIPLS